MSSWSAGIDKLKKKFQDFRRSNIVSSRLKSEKFSERHYVNLLEQTIYIIATESTSEKEEEFRSEIKKIIGDTTFNLWKEEVWKEGTFNDGGTIKTSWDNLSSSQRQDFLDIAEKYIGGNCGELSNFFLRINETPKTKETSENNATINKILKKYQNLIFRIELGPVHTFAGIKLNSKIEIFQAWQGEYTISQWLKKDKKSFTVRSFKKTLFEVTTSAAKANKFFNVGSSKINFKDPPKVASFSYKILNNTDIENLKGDNVISFLKLEKVADKTYKFQD